MRYVSTRLRNRLLGQMDDQMIEDCGARTKVNTACMRTCNAVGDVLQRTKTNALMYDATVVRNATRKQEYAVCAKFVSIHIHVHVLTKLLIETLFYIT